MLSKRIVPSGLRTSLSFFAFVIALVATFTLSGCGGSSKAPTVAVTASVTTVDGTDTVTLSATVANDKGTDGVSWSVSGGGALSNTTTTSATYTAPAATSTAQTVTVTATSVAETTQTGSVTLTVAAKPAITTPSGAQLTGAVGAAYSLQLTGSGGVSPYTWTLTGGTLPTGWTLTTGGLLTGPAPVAGQAGSIDLTLTVTDSGTPTALTATQQVTVTIDPAAAIAFTGVMPTTATVGTNYSGSAAASGGAGALTYTVLSGALPGGLLLNASTGAITGSPTAIGPFSFTIQAADGFGDTPATQKYTVTVNPGAATHFVVSAPASATAGTPLSVSVTAMDAYGNTATGYTGTIKFTSTDASAVLPANSGLTSGLGSFQATLKTAASQTITATDTTTSSVTGTSGAIAVSASATTHLSVTAPAAETAGSLFSVGVTAEDAYNNTVTSYSGTVHLTSSDKSATLSPDSTLTNGFNNITVTLKTAGSQTVTATDTVTSSITGTTGAIVVSAGPASHLAVTAPATATAGTAITVSVTAMDTFGNIDTNYPGIIHFTSTDGAAALPANSALTSGQGSFPATMKTVGSWTITATDTATSSITGVTGTIAVSPGVAKQFAVSAPTTATAGTQFSFTVTAQDGFSNTVPSYSGTVHFTSTDASAVMPANATLTNGVGSFHATLETAASETITATDTATSSITGTTSAIVVSAGAATHLVVTAPATATAGTSFTVGVLAKDGFNNTATGYTGTVQFSSTGGAPSLPGNSTLTNGEGNFPATMKTVGSFTITATDTVTSSITGTTGAIAVSPGAATHFVASAPASATAGTSVSVSVTAFDVDGNIATGYTGSVHLTSTDSQAALPANSGLTSGQGSFSVTLKTAGNQTITATDTTTSSVTGTTNTIAVSAAAATHFSVTAPGTMTAGSLFSVSVTAKDAYNNTAISYAGTVHLTSTDSSAVLATDFTLSNGANNVTVTLKTAGSQTVTATDTVTSSITGTSGAIVVSPGPATHLVVTAPATATAGTPISLGVTALDQYGNTVTGYTGTVEFTSTDTVAALPGNSLLTKGVGSFSATMKTAGSQIVRATDAATPSITGTTSAIAVSPGAANRFVLTGGGTATAGSPFSFTVTVQDAYSNIVPTYAGTVHFTSTDPLAILPGNSVLTNGLGNFQAKFETAATESISATDTVTPSITGMTSPVVVSPSAATHLLVTAPSTAATGIAFNFTVTAQDTYNNTATGYTGTVHFTCSDVTAVLPANSTLVNGQGTFSITMSTVGAQIIAATDTLTSTITGTSSSIAVSTLSINPASSTLTPAYTGTAYSQTFTASGGTAPYTWSLTAGGSQLTPVGLTFTASTGVLSGTAASLAAGSATFTLTVTDKNNATTSKQFTVNVYNPLVLPAPSSTVPGPAIYGQGYGGSIVVTGGSGSYGWSITNSGLAAAGFTYSTTGGTPTGSQLFISGTAPSTVQTIKFTVTVTDSVTSKTVGPTVYSIVVGPQTPLLLSPASGALNPAVSGQNYNNNSISLANGTNSGYAFTVTGSGVTAINSSSWNLPDSLSANSNNGVLTISGTPSGSTPISLVVSGTDSGNDTAGPNTYTIAVGSQVSGQINLNSCGGNTTNTAMFTVNLYSGLNTTTGTPVQTQTTTGNFAFADVPDGNYTIAPSITGPSAIFYPASENVTVSGGNVNGNMFNVALGYTVTGTVSYSGPQTGQVYLALAGSSCGSGGPGTSINVTSAQLKAGAAYTIRGVPPGSYTLLATMDNLGYGMLNTSNPTSAVNAAVNVTVTNTNLSSQDVTLGDPTVTAPSTSTGPTLDGILPNNLGVVIAYVPITANVTINNNQQTVEAVTSYTVEWSTTATFPAPSSSNSHTFAATGGNSNVLILTNALTGVNLASNTPYYFRVNAANSAGTSGWTTYSKAGTPVAVSLFTSTAPSGYYSVSGSVTIPSGVTPKGPLYVGLYSDSGIFSTVIPLTSISTSSANNFTVYAPDGSGYFLFAILDQNNDGMIDAGNISNTNDKNAASVTVNGADLTGQDPVLPSTDVTTVVTTQYQSSTNDNSGTVSTSASYSLSFQVEEENKLPVAVTLISGPNVINPVDLNNLCNGCGHAQFQYNANVNSDMPLLNDTYTFNVTYSDGSTDSTVTAVVNGVLGTSQLATGQSPTGTTGVSTAPDFTWTYPASASSYTYKFSVSNSNNNGIWQIPGNNSKSNGFTSSQIPVPAGIQWPTDPTDASNGAPSGLASGTYNWSLETIDSNGNSASTGMYFIVP